MVRSLTSLRHYAKAGGLSMPQFSLMMRLYHGGGCEVHDIGSQFDVTSAAASQMVERLAQGGLVVRAENPDDRRVRQITITAKGRALIDRGMDERYRWVDELVGFIPAAHRAAVLAALPVLIEAEKKLPQLHPHPHSREAIMALRERH
ncbi:MAG: MarR family transcriptional regulator [Spirochaetia bacterium]|jgi:DNA-binding MarR family transcriptional regulator